MAKIVEQWDGPAWQFRGGPRDGEEIPDGCYRDGQIYGASREGHYRIETRNGRSRATGQRILTRIRDLPDCDPRLRGMGVRCGEGAAEATGATHHVSVTIFAPS